jgi:integrase
MIKKYVDRINSVNISGWTVQEVKKFLVSDSGAISFSDFANMYVNRMRNDGRDKPAANYTTALHSLERYFGKRQIDFSDITSKMLREWIRSLSETKRAKEMYPVIIKKLFDEGCMEYNDYERNIIRIPGQPFRAVRIPRADMPRERCLEVEALRRILDGKPAFSREELAHDVAMLVFCLAGINAVDLYNLEKREFTGGKICYNRTKTERERTDRAYMEIAVREEILPLFEKYKGAKYLFNFRERYSDPDNFSRAVNTGLRSLCTRAGTQVITVYWLRHTWATVAKNECGASTELVAFALNHVSAHRVTEGYIRRDYSPVDALNGKVLQRVFGRE